MVKYSIGIDFGGSHIACGLFLGSALQELGRVCVLPSDSQKVILHKLLDTMTMVSEGRPISSIGIGMPGPADYRNGIVKKTPNLPFRNINLKKAIARKFPVPLAFGNDANCFALAEAVRGPAKKYSTVVGITLGTGVGSGVIIGKKICSGRGNAAELGHMTIDYEGPRCTCGNRGCLEAYCSTRGLMHISRGLPAQSPLEVHALAKRGSAKAKAAFEQYGFYLGVGLANITHAFDPDCIVLGGGLSGAYPFYKKALQKTMRERCILAPPLILISELGDKAGVIGAQLLLGQEL